MVNAIPQRKCVVCRRLRPRSELLRLSAPTSAGLVPNPDGRLGGKGYYVCKDGDCVAKLRTDRKMRKVFTARISDETYAWLTAHWEGEAAPPAPADTDKH